MHVFISRDELLKACQNVVGAVERKQTLPILSNILLEVDEKTDRLYTTATDLELELKSYGQIKELLTPGKITVSARKLLDITKTLPSSSTIELKINAAQLTIKSGNKIFNLVTKSADEYPSIEELKVKKVTVEFQQGKLKKLLNKTTFSIPQQDVRYFLNGMLFEIEPRSFNFVSTDGHRLTYANMNLPELNVNEKVQVIVPRKTIIELSSLLSQDEDKLLKLIIGENHLIIESDDFRMTSKLIDGKYPNYTRILSKDSDKMITVNREELKISLNCLSVLANEKFRGVRLFLTNQLIQMSANNSQQEEADENIAVDYSGPDMDIAFNIDYLIDICNVYSSSAINIGLLNADSPIVIEEDQDGIKYIYIVMPMQL